MSIYDVSSIIHPIPKYKTSKHGIIYTNEILKAWVISQRVLQLRNGSMGCEMALVCQGVVSQLQKFSQGVVMGLQNHFAVEGHFHSQPLIS